jgi:hypothetical protein
MANSARVTIAMVIAAALSSVFVSACGIEAVTPAEAKSPAEQLAERFTGVELAPSVTQPEAAIVTTTAPAATDDSARKVAEVKRNEAKARKAEAAANAAKAKQRATDQAKSDEAEMLAVARAEADERLAAQVAARLDQSAKDGAAAEAPRVTAAVDAAAGAAQQLATELRMTEDRRAAEEELIAEAKRQTAIMAAEKMAKSIAREQQARDSERDKARDKERDEAAAKAADHARSSTALAEANAKAVETSRAVALIKGDEQLPIQVRDVPGATERSSPVIKATEPARAPLGVAGLGGPALGSLVVSPLSRATLLIVMEPGTKGIRRLNKTADPVLCVTNGCYVSEGAALPARLSSRMSVLGVGNTLGRRAGACQQKLGCAFRGIDLALAQGYVQPVDMKVMVHDRRESQTIKSDSDCQLDAARLSCRRPIAAQGYRMWVVPEALAEAAGSQALEAALNAGLVQSRSATLSK